MEYFPSQGLESEGPLEKGVFPLWLFWRQLLSNQRGPSQGNLLCWDGDISCGSQEELSVLPSCRRFSGEEEDGGWEFTR